MAADVSARIGDCELRCPICQNDRYQKKLYYVVSRWMQYFNLESSGSEGIQLICSKCSFIQHFANKNAVTLS